MKKLISATIVTVALAGCTSSRLPPQVEDMPRASPAKRIMIVGNEVTLPDGSRSTMDSAGGFLLPNGDRVARDARGALLLPNGTRCLPDSAGYVCP
ncbi:MAG: hypothetical protein DCF30_22970 [Hyphomicrobiales bacterium]|nr:MAG: hypothetical protein DCF30_22970 [Hyphomicrobiales bacterium]